MIKFRTFKFSDKYAEVTNEIVDGQGAILATPTAIVSAVCFVLLLTFEFILGIVCLVADCIEVVCGLGRHPRKTEIENVTLPRAKVLRRR